jgi:hypothetical protein
VLSDGPSLRASIASLGRKKYNGNICAGAALSSTIALHKGPVTAVAALPEPQGPLAMTGGQDTVVLLCSVPALSAGPGYTAPAAVQPMVAYRCLPSVDHTSLLQSWGHAEAPESGHMSASSHSTNTVFMFAYHG